MKTAIVYYSKHHGNTKKLVDAIATQYDIEKICVVENKEVDLSAFDCIGFASGAYFSSFAKQLLTFAEKFLPSGKDVFFINTCGVKTEVYFESIRKIAKVKRCRELGAYQCLGYDTFGPFKLVGGIAKGHPNADDVNGAVMFYQNIKNQMELVEYTTDSEEYILSEILKIDYEYEQKC